MLTLLCDLLLVFKLLLKLLHHLIGKQKFHLPHVFLALLQTTHLQSVLHSFSYELSSSVYDHSLAKSKFWLLLWL